MNIRDIQLFKNLNDDEFEKIKRDIDIEEKVYEKDEYIFRQNEIGENLFILEKGKIEVSKFDNNGKRYIVNTLTPIEPFGEVYAILEMPYDFSAIAIEKSKIYIIKNLKEIVEKKASKKFLINIIRLLSKKSLYLSRKNQITSKFTLRQKISNYLILNAKDDKVKLKMTREEWADYLSVTRPSLSRELSKMQEEGLIQLDKNTVILKNKQELEGIL
ncbi:MAG: Crp/Fnr family transcriptional regulator [Tissierellia bacterium]|nr:Crp/Fnr family transcriptional regulator [Tissierellia bacterium]